MPDAISETGSEGIRAPAADPGQGTNDRRRTCHKDTRRTHAVCPPVSARGALQFQSHQSRPRHPRGLDWLDTPMSPCGFWRHGWGEPSLMPSSCQQGLERSIADSERHRLGRGSFRIRTSPGSTRPKPTPVLLCRHSERGLFQLLRARQEIQPRLDSCRLARELLEKTARDSRSVSGNTNSMQLGREPRQRSKQPKDVCPRPRRENGVRSRSESALLG